MKNFLILFLLSFFTFSCTTYQKALKSEDTTFQYNVAVKMYEKGKFDKAIRLFEQIAPSYRGNPQSENMFYLFSQSYYKSKQHYLAAYQFEKFASSYPKSEKIEEASFLSAKSFSKLSPVYSLDQVDTYKAIDKLQAFIDSYSNSQYLPEANQDVKILREKIEKKAFENAKEYNKISDYKSAIVALDNFVGDFPGTPYKEDALYYKFDSAYKLAINSIPNKMEERLNNSKIAYNNLIKFNASSQYKQKADVMLARINKDLQQFSK